MKLIGVIEAAASLRRCARSERGSALVELALVLPVLAILTLGAIDFGRAFQQQHRIASAAQAGAQQALQERSALETPTLDEIEARVREEAGDTTNELAVTPRFFCVCTGETAEVACDASPPAVCPAGNARPLLRFVEVDVQHSVDLMFPYPGVPSTLPLQALFTMQI